MEVPKLATCLLGTVCVDLAIASATAEGSVGPYRVNVSDDQIVLPGSSHSCLRFSLCKEAKADEM